ncbi:hypothetical protein QOZ80_1BG0048540 [Eleusine coracana subsp. coracana]|nr:hypothetical protein QOZ80_1BG0048540 [Eleusine coracana subsp. coracana]
MSAPSWFILGSVPRVSDDDELEEHEVSVALAAPPRVTVPRRIAPDPITPANFPAFRAADPSAGLLLLVASSGSLAAAGFVVMLPTYFVCDLGSGTASPTRTWPYPLLPPRPRHHRHARRTLHWSGWRRRTSRPLIRHHHQKIPDAFHGSITHDAKLHLSHGLLTCDPKHMSFQRHPQAPLSAGKLRFRRADKVTMWTLQEENDEHWVSFQHLRASSDPVLAFVHPTNLDVVYFFIHKHLLGVHMRAVKV